MLAKVSISAEDCLGGGSRLQEVMDEFGFAIVTGVLSESELARARQQFNADLSEIRDGDARAGLHPSVSEALRRTAAAEDLASCWPPGTKLGNINGFAGEHGIAHGRFAWEARLNPKLRVRTHVLITRAPHPVSYVRTRTETHT